MITFTSLGKKGNLGNQLFHIASTIGIANKYKHEYIFPEWSYYNYFKHEFPFVVRQNDIKFEKLIEKSFSHYDWELGNDNYDINGALQSEKYFDIKKTKEIFLFKDEFLQPLLDKHKYLFTKKTVFISVRRGDFVGHPHYYQLSYKYYLLALINNFPDWEERNLIFTSDDIKYCKYHFNFLKNAFFLENLSAVEQLAISTQGNDFIISNSTFSWWMAWLAEQENTKIIRPLKNFRGKFSQINDDKDYFPERWIIFNHKKHSLNLKYFFVMIKGFLYEVLFRIDCAIKRFFSLLNKIIKKINK